VANGFQLAAWTPSGTSVVEFSYRPVYFTAGLILSAAGLLALLVLGLGGRTPVRR